MLKTRINTKKQGFSLIEVAMILSLMIVVALPTVQALTIMKKDTAKTQADTTSNIVLQGLFDVIDPMASDLSIFNVEQPLSVYCDPLNPVVRTNPEMCQEEGDWQNKPPFFTRTVSSQPTGDITNTISIIATVEIRDNVTAPVRNRSHKVFPINEYRLYMTGVSLETQRPLPRKDAFGNTWYPATLSSRLNTQNLFSVSSTGSTHSEGVTPLGNQPYLSPDNYITTSGSSTYRFRVVNGKRYAGKVYLMNYQPNDFPQNRDLLNLWVRSVEAANQTLYTESGIDVDLMTEKRANAITAKAFTFRSPKNNNSGTSYIDITLAPVSGVNDTKATVTAIELIGL